MSSADRALDYLRGHQAAYQRWTGEPVDVGREIAEPLAAVQAAAQPDLVGAGAAALRAGADTVVGSTDVLRDEGRRLESVWVGDAADDFTADLEATVARSATLSDELTALSAAAARHAEAVQELVTGLHRAIAAVPVPPARDPAELQRLVDLAGRPAAATDDVDQARRILDDDFVPDFDSVWEAVRHQVDPCGDDVADLWRCFDTFTAELGVGLGTLDAVEAPGPGPVVLGTLPDDPAPGPARPG